jgi:hypothetical protein
MTRKIIAGLLLTTTLSGCMGNNALTRKALKFNLTTAEGRWTRELLFVGMWVIPVYLVTWFVDVLFINSVEFWTGKNPLSGRGAVVDIPASEIEGFGIDAIDAAQVERLDENHANLYVRFESGDRVTFDVVRDGDHFTIGYGGVEFYRGALKL